MSESMVAGTDLSRRLILVGMDHRSVPHDAIEFLHTLRREKGSPPQPLADGGAVALATCQRLELYVEDHQVESVVPMFWQWLTGEKRAPAGFDASPTVRLGTGAARHLLAVTAGLESSVLGEDQILGQVRRAYRDACAAGTPGPLLHKLFHAAFRTGKRVRTTTELASGGRSLSGAAVSVIHQELGDFKDKAVLVLGLGEMGDLAARRLRKRGVKHLLLTNRTYSKAEKLAVELGGEAVTWDRREEAFCSVDAMVCATDAPEPVVNAKTVISAAGSRKGPLVVIDLAVPSNVERPPEILDQLVMLDIGTLTERLARESSRRHEAIDAAREVVEDSLNDWTQWVLARGDLTPAAKGECRRLRATTDSVAESGDCP